MGLIISFFVDKFLHYLALRTYVLGYRVLESILGKNASGLSATNLEDPENDQQCILVIMDTLEDGNKKLVAVSDVYRENK